MNEFYKQSLRLLMALVIGFSCFNQAQAQNAIATNAGVTNDSTYFIKITGLTDGDDYNFFVDGTAASINTHTAAASGEVTLSEEQSFVDGREYKTVQIVNTASPLDTITSIVHEILIVDADKDGDFDYSQASCDYTNSSEDRGTIVASVAPYNGENVYLYMLADTTGMVDSSDLIYNYSGHFTDLAPGNYTVYAYNFLDTFGAIAFLDSVDNSTTYDLDDFNAVGAPFCFNSCGDHDYEVESCPCPLDITTEPEDVMACAGSEATFNAEGMLAGTLPTNLAAFPTPNSIKYQWQDSTTGAGFVNMADDTLADLMLTNVTEMMDSSRYRVIVSFEVRGKTICSDTSSSAMLEILPNPELLSSLDTMVCSGESIGIVLALTDTPAADSFDIVSITDNGLVGDASNATTGLTSDASVISGDVWTNTGASDVTVTYEVAPRRDGCIGDTISIDVTVKPAPFMEDDVVETVCSDDMIGVSLAVGTGSAAADSFIISAIDDGGLTAGADNFAAIGDRVGSDTIMNDTWTNITGDTVNVLYTVAAVSADGCTGPADTITIKVASESVFDEPILATVCTDEAIGVMLPSNTDNDTPMSIDSFNIVNIDVGTGLTAAAGNANTGVYTLVSAIDSDEYSNTTGSVDSAVYTIVPFVGDCMGDTLEVRVRITPGPIGIDSMLIVCSDEALDIDLTDLITNGMTGVEFSWSAAANANVTGETTTASTSSSITDVLTNTTASQETVVYTVITKAAAVDGDCAGDTLTITVNVDPEPVYSGETLTVCSDEAFTVDLTDNGPGTSVAAASFSYSYTSTDGDSGSGTTTDEISDTFENLTTSAIDYTYKVVPISTAGCSGDTFDVVITVDPEPFMATDIEETVCSDSPIGVTLSVDGSSAGADSFNIVNITVDPSLATISVSSTGYTSDPNEIANDAFENTTTGSLTVTYDVVPISGTCVGDTVTITVTIDPEVSVEAGTDQQICSNGVVTLSDLGASIDGSASGTWTTSGTGTFDDSAFSTATTYTPSAADREAGTVTLTLTSGAATTGSCPSDSDTVTITIDNVECSTFPWTGNE